MRKIITIWLCLIICMTYLNVQAQNGIKPNGSGTIDSPYVIETAENFYWLLETSKNNGVNEILIGKLFELNNNITLEKSKIPDLDAQTAFMGILDGKNNTIEVTGGAKTLFSNIIGAPETAIVKNLNIVMTGDVQGMTFAANIKNANIENISLSLNGDVKLLKINAAKTEYFASGFAHSISESTVRNVKVNANNIGNDIDNPSAAIDGYVVSSGFVYNVEYSKLHDIETTINNKIYANGKSVILCGAISQLINDKVGFELIIDGFTLNVGNPTSKNGGLLGKSTTGNVVVAGFSQVMRYSTYTPIAGIKLSNIDINVNGDITGTSTEKNISGMDRNAGFLGVYIRDIWEGGIIDLINPIYEFININITGDMSLYSADRMQSWLSGFSNEIINNATKNININIGGNLKSSCVAKTIVTGLGADISGSEISINIDGNLEAETGEYQAYAFGLGQTLKNANNIRLYIAGDLKATDLYEFDYAMAIGAAKTINNAQNIGVIIDGDIISNGGKAVAMGFGNDNGTVTSFLQNLSVTVHGDISATSTTSYSKHPAHAAGFIGECNADIKDCTVYIGGSINVSAGGTTGHVNASSFINTLLNNHKISNSASFLGGDINFTVDENATKNIGMFIGTSSGIVEECSLILSPVKPDEAIEAGRYINFVGKANAGSSYVNNTFINADGQFRAVFLLNQDVNTNQWTIGNEPLYLFLLNKNYGQIKTNVNTTLTTQFLMANANITKIYGHGSITTNTTDKYKHINIFDNKSQIGFNSATPDGINYTFDILQVCPKMGMTVAVTPRDMVAYQGGTSIASGRFPRPYCYIVEDGVELTDEQRANLKFYVNGASFTPGSAEATSMGFYYEYPFNVEFYDKDGNIVTEEEMKDEKIGTYTMIVTSYGKEITVQDNIPDAKFRGVGYPNGIFTLEIRPVLEPSDIPPYEPVLHSEPTEPVDAATAVIPSDAQFTNSAGVPVINDGVNSNVTLLLDNVYDVDKKEELEAEVRNNKFTQGMAFDLVYLDLVDTKNGNIVVDSDKPTEVLLPYLANTTNANPYKILHFKNKRSGSTEAGNLENNIEQITPEKTELGLKFTVNSFSPFAIATEYEINATVAGDPIDGIKGGTISYKEANIDGIVYAGEGNHVFTFTPNNDHYFISKLIVDGAEIAIEDSYTFTNVTVPHSIIVEFSLDSHKITAKTNNGGTINDAGEVILRHGTTKTYTMAPAAGYVISNVLIDGLSIGIVDTYTFNNLDTDHTIEVKFTCVQGVPYSENFNNAQLPSLPECTTSENAGDGNNWTIGHITSYGFKSKVLLYVYNTKQAANAWFYTSGLELEAGKTYTLNFKYGNNTKTKKEKLKVCYGTVADHSMMTTELFNRNDINQMIMAEANIQFSPAADGVYFIGFNAYSDANQWNLFVDDIEVFEGNKISIATNEGGEIMPTNTNESFIIFSDEYMTNLVVPYNKDATFNIIAENGYQIESVFIDGQNIGVVESYTFKNVYEAHTLSANFSQAPTNVEDNDNLNAKIYSFGTDIKVNLANISYATVEIIDITGRVVLNKEITDGETIINMTQQGVYIVKLTNQDGIIKTEKVIIR